MFHNLSGYDAHLFMKELGKKFNRDDTSVIAENKEKYISFNVKINVKLAGVCNKDGKAILDLSKTLMYEFHYEYMQPKYGSKIGLCYMDTDSFVYEIEAEYFYRDIAKDVETKFDTSGYSKDYDRPLLIGKNKNVIGMMKDELGGKIMTEFVKLRAKMYGYRKIDKKVEDKRCKGTKKFLVAESFAFDGYKACLFDGKTIYKEQMLFENKKHELYTVNKHKIALNRDDDKRLVKADGITTLARGYLA